MLTTGSRGDLQPVVAIGGELLRRGHHVTAAVNSDLAGWVARAGIETVPTGLDVGRFLHSPEARRFLATGRAGAAIRRITADERRVNGSIVDACRRVADGADIVVSTLLMGYRGRCLEDATGVPSGTLVTFPVQPASSWASVLSPVRDLKAAWANRASARMFHRLIWAQHRRTIDEMSDTLGIARYRRRPRIERQRSLHVYSAALASAEPDPRHAVVGWTALSPNLRQRLGEGAVSDALRTWLDAGPPPVFFGFGSMPVLDPASLVRDVARSTGTLGLRGLVGAGWTEYGSAGGLPDHLFLATGEIDHDQVLPRCRAAVHHGGAGTTGSVLRAGLPSVVASVFADQPFWGWRVERAGVGITMPFRKLSAERLEVALERVLDSGMAERAARLGAVVRAEDGTTAGADVIEGWAGRG